MNDATEDYIRRTVDAAPPLTDEQRDRLAAIFGHGTLASTVPAPDETTARQLLAMLHKREAKISKPLDVDVDL